MKFSEKYSLVKELGRGHSHKFGRVFFGISNNTGENVLLKFVTRSSNGVGEHRLRNEASFNFDIPGLPRIIDFYETENECILVRAYEEGIPLYEFWKTRSKNERIPFVISLTETMHAFFQILTESKTIHCDIKPSNILVREKENEFEFSLIDFGLAVRTSDLEKRNILFPLGFAAPELILNQLHLLDHRTDQFALGIVIWYLFTGGLPLTHSNPSVYTNLQLTHPLPDHSALPKGIFEILKKMTHKHVFRTAPNLLAATEVEESLKNGIAQRYDSLSDVISDLKNLSQKKRWFGF